MHFHTCLGCGHGHRKAFPPALECSGAGVLISIVFSENGLERAAVQTLARTDPNLRKNGNGRQFRPMMRMPAPGLVSRGMIRKKAMEKVHDERLNVPGRSR
jgi:hypothetical protein